MLRLLRCAALLAASVTAGTAAAGPAPETPFGVSTLALPSPAVAALVEPAVAPEVAAVGFAPAPPPALHATRYRPRRGWSRRPRHVQVEERSHRHASPFQVHAGFFELEESDAPSSFVVGLRGGPATDPHVQIAFGLDWMHNGERSRTVTGEPYEQGGVIIVPQRELARASSDLLPITANLQVNLASGGPVIPYVGIGGGYQILWLSAEDLTTGEDYDATFGGWSWQLFGGLQLPLSGATRLVGEAFLHRGDAEREVEDVDGFTYREIVDLDGGGLRFGLSWGF